MWGLCHVLFNYRIARCFLVGGLFGKHFRGLHPEGVFKYPKFVESGNLEILSLSTKLGAGFKYVLFSPRKLGKIPIFTTIFQRG